MKFVVDASVALKWALPEADSDKARRLREEFKGDIHEFVAPDIFPLEVAHTLVKARQQRIIDQGDVEVLFAKILTPRPRLVQSIRLLPRAVAMAQQYRLTVYDCLYAVLSVDESCQLLTADSAMANARGVQVCFLNSLP